MAPERLRNSPSYSYKADIYSFGITMWSLFPGCENLNIFENIKDLCSLENAVFSVVFFNSGILLTRFLIHQRENDQNSLIYNSPMPQSISVLLRNVGNSNCLSIFDYYSHFSSLITKFSQRKAKSLEVNGMASRFAGIKNNSNTTIPKRDGKGAETVQCLNAFFFSRKFGYEKLLNPILANKKKKKIYLKISRWNRLFCF